MDSKRLPLLPRETSGVENIRLKKFSSKGIKKSFIADFGLRAGHQLSHQLSIDFKLQREKLSAGTANIGKIKNFFTIQRLICFIEERTKLVEYEA